MQISSELKDALAEIVNIGFGKAASSLSILIGQRILLEAPEAELYPFSEIDIVMSKLVRQNAMVVHQAFNGRIEGDVLLILDQDSSAMLVDLLSGGNGTIRRLTVSDREALLEIGNILLNAYIGSFGNLLQFKIGFSLPRLILDPISVTIASLVKQDDYYSLVVRTEFHVMESSVAGYVALILGTDSLNEMLKVLKEEL